MINFSQISRLEIDDLEKIIDEKYNPQKADLIRLKSAILKSYNDYADIENCKRLKKTGLSDADKNTLLTLYNSLTKTAQIVIQIVVDNLNPKHESKCLFCGIGECDEMDHYLPKEHFPEYSILFKNLLPICGKCNKKKGQKIPGDSLDYLHLTYDKISIDDYLEIDFRINPGSSPIINYKILNTAKPIIENHINALNLIKRYNKKGVQYILRINALCDDFGKQYALDELKRNFKETSIYFGENFWKSVLIKKLLEIKYLDQYCA